MPKNLTYRVTLEICTEQKTVFLHTEKRAGLPEAGRRREKQLKGVK